MAANGGGQKQMTNGVANSSRPSWSHDGKWLYFTSSRCGRDGSGETRIADFHYSGGSSQNIAPAKEGLFYRTARPDSVWFHNFADGKTHMVFKTDKPLDAGISVSPDGRWLLYTQVDG